MSNELSVRIVELMNSAFKADPKAMEQLIEARVPCNTALRNHPTIQVGECAGESPRVGLLGILNGIVGVDFEGWGRVAATYSDDEPPQLIGFQELKRDIVTDHTGAEV